jgi:hypothetical protein
MYITAGFDGILEFGDIWEFDLHLHVWREITNFGTLSPRRLCTLTAFDDSLHILGGFYAKDTSGLLIFLSDFYRYNLKGTEEDDVKWVGFEDVVIFASGDEYDVSILIHEDMMYADSDWQVKPVKLTH